MNRLPITEVLTIKKWHKQHNYLRLFLLIITLRVSRPAEKISKKTIMQGFPRDHNNMDNMTFNPLFKLNQMLISFFLPQLKFLHLVHQIDSHTMIFLWIKICRKFLNRKISIPTLFSRQDNTSTMVALRHWHHLNNQKLFWWTIFHQLQHLILVKICWSQINSNW